MYILFDTNIWRSELALNSSAGAATRFFVRERGATVVVPEVVRLELERILFRTISEFVEKINKDHRQLLTIFGELKELVLPDKSEIKKRVERFVDELDVPVKEMPFTIQEAKSSFLKVVDGLPPSGDKNQQFKDGVIWAHCVELLKDRDVYLITEDRSFFKDKEEKRARRKSKTRNY